MMKIINICLLLLLNNVNSFPNLNFQKTNIDPKLHLNIEYVQRLCANRDKVCASNDTDVCAVRMTNETLEYRHFENSCYLFMINMCEEAGHEFNINGQGSCEQYKTRRSNKQTNKKNISRSLAEPTHMSTLYDVPDAFDGHNCPLSCPDLYSPVCIGVNRGHGLYYKFYTFINHCEGDLYYCKNWREFSPPPEESGEIVRSSPLSWSFCAANRYIQFARFAEMTTSMGHYGWLSGDYKPTHIMNSRERLPGYG